MDDGANIGVGAYRLRYHRRNQDETADADAMEQEWREASKYVASILPKPINQGPVRANWFYQPSTRIGGDAFGYQMLDQRHFSLFLLDVSGHGTGAAMHAMTVAQVLRERVLPDVDFLDPAAVIGGLNARFQMHRNNDLFFTIWYGVYDIVDRVLIFAPAAITPRICCRPTPLPGRRCRWTRSNPIVGMLPDPRIAAADVEVPPGSTLHLVQRWRVRSRRSRGSPTRPGRHPADVGRRHAAGDPPAGDPATGDPAAGNPRPATGAHATAPDDPKRLYDRIRAIARPGPLDDDFSALVFRFP